MATACLNPFEFRAGLERGHGMKRLREFVLIPLNSGLAWSKDPKSNKLSHYMS